MFCLLLALLLALFSGYSSADEKHRGQRFETLEWPSLMPSDDLEALLNPPKYITEVEDGSIEDQISAQVQNSLAAANDDRYQQALRSTRAIKKLHNKAIRIPGFVVPLAFSGKQQVSQFFLVPYFGACLHLPPPPPNQIIFVDYPKGYELESLYDPVWLRGVLKLELKQHEMGQAAYRLELFDIAPYEE